MQIHIDGEDLLKAAGNPVALRIIRSAAYFLLASVGDIPEETEIHTATGADLDKKFGVVPTGTSATPPLPSAPNTATAPASVSSVAPAAVSAPPLPVTSLPATVFSPPPPPPPPASDLSSPPPRPPGTQVSDLGFRVSDDDNDEGANMGNVPPPPPGTANTAGTNSTQVIPSIPDTSPGANSAAAAPGVASVEVDSAGIPWDDRIHQKGKSKKKDNTWKLKKGIDPALVVSVTAELAARRAASPAPTAGSLPLISTPTGSNTVPVPPVSNGAAAPGVPAPNNVGSPVPVPPVPAVGAMGASDTPTPYRKLIDKITDLTKAGKLTPAKVSEICTSHGSPSLMALKQFEALIPNVDKDIDAAALGLL